MKFSHYIAMPSERAALSYWPEVVELSSHAIDVFFGLDEDDRYLAYKYDEWTVVEVSTSEGWDRLHGLVTYQTDRLSASWCPFFHGNEWYMTEETSDPCTKVQTIHLGDPAVTSLDPVLTITEGE